MVQCLFCSSFSPLFEHVDLVMPSLNAWFQIYLSYLALGFVHVDQDGDMNCWEFNLISGLFAFLC